MSMRPKVEDLAASPSSSRMIKDGFISARMDCLDCTLGCFLSRPVATPDPTSARCMEGTLAAIAERLQLSIYLADSAKLQVHSMSFFKRWMSFREGRIAPPAEISISAEVLHPEDPAKVSIPSLGRFVEGEDTAAYRARLVRQLTAEGTDCAVAYKIITDEISKIPEADERMHASGHEIRYLTTYSITPPGPGVVVDIAGSQIYGAPLKALKNWTIEAIPVLAFDYEIDRLPFANQSVDGVMICEVLEHFTLDPLHCLIEANRILKPGGFIVLTTPNAASWFSIHKALNNEHPSRWAVYSVNEANRKNHIHAREYLVSEVALLLDGAGFGGIETFTRDYAINPPHRPIEGFSTENREETIFARAYKMGPPKKRSVKPVYLDDVDFVPGVKPS